MISNNPSARLTPESKAALRKTIRGLRDVLLRDLRGYAEQLYLLKVPIAKAKSSLSQPMFERRRRLDSALAERAAEEGGTEEARERAMANAVKEAGATLLNRLVLIRHLEAVGLSKPAVVTGGWKSGGYQQFRGYAPELIGDKTQGYAVLLQLLFDELAAKLPGLFGEVGLTALFPAPPDMLRAVIEALDKVPAEAWRDDMTLGWVYQYWNDPDREALDIKLDARIKLEPHEIASKTQMFTERYMVEWLLHNSLGPTWLAMCRKNGWVADVEQHGVLKALDERRAEWREKRKTGEVALDALMPIKGPLEEAWKYYVPQPLQDEVVKHAPASIRELKLIDPACGSGHFLVVAFDLLVELYREEARHRGESWTDQQIVEWILENNLHGVDIDPRAVQIAAAAIFLKARTLAKDASPRHINLVAPVLRLSALDRKDPTLLKLERDIELETGIPPELTRQLLDVLAGVDHLGTLLKVGDAVDRAIDAYRGKLGKVSRQGELFAAAEAEKRTDVDREDAKKVVLERLNAFLENHAGEEDLGLRLRGQQLTAGLRFASIVREGEYHLVVTNPPYQGTSRLKNAGYVAKHYPRGKSDLYAAFLERGLELCRPGGASAMVTMRNWMFLSGFTALREHLLQTYDLRIIGDVDRGAFEEILDEVVATTMSVFRRAPRAAEPCIAMQPTPLSDKSRDSNRTARKRAAVVVQVGRFEFLPARYRDIALWPLVYWWPDRLLKTYLRAPKLGEQATVTAGAQASPRDRFLRFHWEFRTEDVLAVRTTEALPPARQRKWVPYIGGGKGRKWIEPLVDVINWENNGLTLKVWHEFKTGTVTKRVAGESYYFAPGISATAMGHTFQARVQRFLGIPSEGNPAVYGGDRALLVLNMNAALPAYVLESFNPGTAFEVGDVKRMPLLIGEEMRPIWATLEDVFDAHERVREPSVDFRAPGPSAWEGAQSWAERLLGADASSPPTNYQPKYDAPTPDDVISFSVGLALGRFHAENPPAVLGGDGQAYRLPSGILFLNGTLPYSSTSDSLGTPACRKLLDTWAEVGGTVDGITDIREFLRTAFFGKHRKRYQARPIYFPVSSAQRTFVAFISIHRWNDSTLSTLLVDYLIPEQKVLQGALADLQTARGNPDKKIRAAAEKNYVQHKKWLEELEEFIHEVHEVAEKGPPPPDDKTEHREVDAPFRMNLDDGVMVNSAALWPLLEPMWKDPKKWWKDLANAKGKKDYDWSHLAMRYFPSRVDEKCRKDPSFAVAHGCFWKYHPEKAYQWELRLQDEIDREFKLDEKDSHVLRAAFLEKQPSRARELEAAERARRERKARKQDQEELDLSDAYDEESEDDEAVSA